MTEDQFTAFENFIQAKIKNEIERAFGRDALQETIREIDYRKELRVRYGLPEHSSG